MTKEKRFTVHIKWFNYEKTEGEIELFDNGQPLLVSECIKDVQMVKDLLNELHEENQYLKSLKWNQDCIKEISIGMQQRQSLEILNNKLVKENEQLKQENKELKNKLAKVEEILNNRLSNDFRPVHSDGRTELFVEEKAGYWRALKQLKKKLIRENIIEDDMND